MGTNYYIRKKATINLDEPVIAEARQYEQYTKIKNGWLWKDTYYDTLESLNKEYYDELHIGKSSWGWKFLLCSYPFMQINSLEDWKKLWQDPTVEIFSEEGRKLTADEMLSIILKDWKEILQVLDRTNNEYLPILQSFDTYEITNDADFS